ncbi:hypothetical protein [Flavobacterium selenitireducens]|uniref:hypothetical protein n=1 Tax=Flavobacterium selenitireducens TaxID=2722704 RepID=UPI00168A879D|nr:hypothetical protein [Flavobacterium selenitireducens]MBD3584060.1 hypothetical protein [Flavobacterium selenitireducens]
MGKSNKQTWIVAYHFQNAKDKIVSLIEDSDAKITAKVLDCLSSAFTTEEQIMILKIAFNSNSKKVKMFAADKALYLQNVELNEFLNSEYLNQSDLKVKESIRSAMKI